VRLQIGLPTRRDGFAYARLTTADSVYQVNTDIIDATKMAPGDWRERLLRTLPAGAKIVAIALTDLAADKPVVEWKASPGAESPAGNPDLAAVLDAFRTLRAREFVRDSFADRAILPDGEERPWRYRLDATLALPGGTGAEQTGQGTLWLSDRLAGDRQVAGSKEVGAEFLIEQKFLDALFHLTNASRDPGPPAEIPPPK
jgi:hypothetical protein